MQLDCRHGNLEPESAVTIIVVPRERFSHSRASLESLYANTHMPFRLIYVDGGSPAPVKRYLEIQAKEKRFQLIRTEHYLSPNQARNIGLRRADTKYVLFIDNDVEVASGWLQELLRCAEDTDASIVGPLYCIGQPLHEVIHMVGCEASVREIQGRRRIYEQQSFCNQRVRDVRPQLSRQPCDMVEFHCMLARREVLKQLGPLDEALTTRDHMDLCFTVREAGGTVWSEPNAVVTYVGASSFAWSDIPFYLLRWSDVWSQTSMRHFERKWNLDAQDWQLHNNWLRPHRQIPLLGLRARVHRFFGARLGDHLMDALEQFLSSEALRKGKGRSPQRQAASSDPHTAPL